MSLQTAIDKATSPDLTEDDYSLLLDVVDGVKSDPNTNVPASIEALKGKLSLTNANVLLRALTLLDFLAENCGAMMKAEIAKKSFVEDYLVGLVHTPHMHVSVKYAVIKEIYKLSKTFKGDDSLRIMEDTFRELQLGYKYLCQQAISEVDSGREPDLSDNTAPPPAASSSQQEEDDIKKAIELSLKEQGGNGASNAAVSVTTSSQAAAPPVDQPVAQQQTIQLPRPDKVRALYDLTTEDEDTLSFKHGDIITIIEPVNNDWIRGCLRGKLGIVPTNYVEKVPQTTEQDLEQLKNSLDRSFDIAVLLSKLMDLNAKVKTSDVSNQEFENYLIKDGIPSKLEELQAVRTQLKKVLDLYKLRISELESMEQDIGSSVSLYRDLLLHSTQQQVTPSAAFLPALNAQFSGMSFNSQSTAPPVPGQPMGIQGQDQSIYPGQTSPVGKTGQIGYPAQSSYASPVAQPSNPTTQQSNQIGAQAYNYPALPF